MPEPRQVDEIRQELETERAARRAAERALEAQSSELLAALRSLQEQSERLHRSERATREIINTTNDAFLATDAGGAIVDWSERSEGLFGWRRDEVMGKDLRTTLLPECRGPGSVLKTLLGGHLGGRRVEARALRRDGETIPVELSISPMLLHGQFVFNAFVHDIRPRQAIQHQLIHAQKLESVGRLAAGIAHEINTPIQYVGDNVRFLRDAVTGLADIVQFCGESFRGGEHEVEFLARCEEIDLPFLLEEAPAAIEEAIGGVERVAHIVRAMKEFSHPGSREKTDTDLNRAIESASMVCRHEWKYVADLVLELDPRLPPIPCLPAEVNQTLLNLIVNAAHAIGEKQQGVSPAAKGRITISSRPQGAWAEVRVSDTGTGIRPENLGKIFDPFFTTKGVGRGTGQGLAIAYAAIVEKNQGEIAVESALGEGTTFIVRLPMADTSLTLAPTSIRENPYEAPVVC